MLKVSFTVTTDPDGPSLERVLDGMHKAVDDICANLEDEGVFANAMEMERTMSVTYERKQT